MTFFTPSTETFEILEKLVDTTSIVAKVFFMGVHARAYSRK